MPRGRWVFDEDPSRALWQQLLRVHVRLRYSGTCGATRPPSANVGHSPVVSKEVRSGLVVRRWVWLRDDMEITVLNRREVRCDGSTTYDADPRIVGNILEAMGLEEGSGHASRGGGHWR